MPDPIAAFVAKHGRHVCGWLIEPDGPGLWRAIDTDTWNHWGTKRGFYSRDDAERYAIAADEFKRGRRMSMPDIPRAA